MSLFQRLSNLAKVEITPRVANSTIAAVLLAIAIGSSLFVFRFIAASIDTTPEPT